MFRARAVDICLSRDMKLASARSGIHVELAGFIILHSRLDVMRLSGAVSISEARAGRKAAHDNDVSRDNGPKARGSCFCSFDFRPAPETFFGGLVTQIKASKGLAEVGRVALAAAPLSAVDVTVAVDPRVSPFISLPRRGSEFI